MLTEKTQTYGHIPIPSFHNSLKMFSYSLNEHIFKQTIAYKNIMKPIDSINEICI